MNEYLIEVEQLLELLDSKPVVLIDTRGPDDYEEIHLPNAIHLYDIFIYLCTRGNGGLPCKSPYISIVEKAHAHQICILP